MKLCECGCGQEVKNRFVTGHWVRINNPMNNEESRRKDSESLKGKNNPMYGKKGKLAPCFGRKGNKHPMFGKHLSEETKIKISLSIIRKGTSKGERNGMYASGENHPFYGKHGKDSSNWHGGISFLPYASDFNDILKDKVRARDNYTCQHPNCKIISKSLDVHHIDYNKMNSKEQNLISLCNKHHSITNGKREYWMMFYKKIIKNKRRAICQVVKAGRPEESAKS